MRGYFFLVTLGFLFALGASVPVRAAGLPACESQWPPGAWRPGKNEAYAEFSARLSRPHCTKEWTILVYMAPTADLSAYALADLKEMQAPFAREGQAASSGKTDLLVQLSTEGEAAARLHLFAEAPKASLDEFKAARVGTAPAQESPALALSEFLRWGAREYPARNYFVVIWGHGRGWQGFELADGKLGVPELKKALQDFSLVAGKPVDVLASDSCFMQTMEVIYELKDRARFIVGSTQAQNFLGLPYRRILYELNTGRFNGQNSARGTARLPDDARLLAEMLPLLTRQSLDPARGTQGKGSPSAQGFMTASAIESARFGAATTPAFRGLGAALAAFLEEDSLRGLDIQLLLAKAAAPPSGAPDAGAFIGLVEKYLTDGTEGSSATREALLRALKGARASVENSRLSLAYGEERAAELSPPSGVSLWLPGTAREYRDGRAEIVGSSFFRDTGWGRWLDLLYGF